MALPVTCIILRELWNSMNRARMSGWLSRGGVFLFFCAAKIATRLLLRWHAKRQVGADDRAAAGTPSSSTSSTSSPEPVMLPRMTRVQSVSIFNIFRRGLLGSDSDSPRRAAAANSGSSLAQTQLRHRHVSSLQGLNEPRQPSPAQASSGATVRHDSIDTTRALSPHMEVEHEDVSDGLSASSSDVEKVE